MTSDVPAQNGGCRSLASLLFATASAAPAKTLLDFVVIPDVFLTEHGAKISRAVIAEALNVILLEDLVKRVPAADCVAGSRARKKDSLRPRALRTVAMARMGRLPAGEAAIIRVLRPLGYVLGGVYPLDRLKMTGRGYVHDDLQEQIGQIFVSELLPSAF